MTLSYKLPLSLLCLAASAGALSAQSYILDNGTILKDSEVKRVGNILVKEIQIQGGGSAEQRYPFEKVARLDWPEPEAIAEATRQLKEGNASAALATITPTYQLFLPFSKISGSWWTQAAVLRLQAMIESKAPEKEVRTAAQEIMRTATDPEIIGNAKLALAQLDVRDGHERLATAMIDAIVADAPQSVRARAWLLRGDIALKQQAFEEAIEAYLHVPAFFGTLNDLMPAALLGSARAYKGYGDADRAERAYLDLIDNYPNTSEAATGKRESGL